MGKRRHKRRAEQHIPADNAPRRAGHGRWQLRALAIPIAFLGSLAALNVALGVPSQGFWYWSDVVAFFGGMVACVHVIAMRFIPLARGRARRPAYGNIGVIGWGAWFNRADTPPGLFDPFVERPPRVRSRRRRWWWNR